MRIQTQNQQTEEDTIDVPQVTFAVPSLEPDLTVQSAEEAEAALKAISEASPFSKYKLPAMLEKLGDKNGTMIFIWNLE